MKTYYHATDPKNLTSIFKEGLKPSFDGLFLCETPNDCLKFMIIRGMTEVLVLEIVVPDSFEKLHIKESFDHSQAFFKCRCFVSDAAISSKNIKNLYKYTL